MEVETWYRIVCPSCRVTNWVCAGDAQDLTGIDPDGFICWKCTSQFDWDGNEGDDKEMFLASGRRKP